MSAFADLLTRWGPKPSGPTLLLNTDDPDVAGALACSRQAQAFQCHFRHESHQAYEREGETVPCFFPEIPTTPYQHVFWGWPKAKEEAGMLLHWLSCVMASDGQLWLLGPNKGGIKSAPKMLTQQGWRVSKVGSARHCVLLKATPPSTVEPFALEAYWRKVPLPGSDAVLWSLPGVFSHGRIDKGSQQLLPWLRDLPSPVLDFGCGAGLLSLALAQNQASTAFTGIDHHWLAILSARQTAKTNGLDFSAHWTDGLTDVTGQYAGLITNPPFHTGLSINYEITRSMIAGSERLLTPGAQWLAVVNDHLPYAEWLKQSFADITCLQHERGFKIWRAIR